MIEKAISEIERLDGEGLIPRKNRPEAWSATTHRLRREAEASKTTYDFGQVLKRLDATYPNLHAHVTLAAAYDLRARGGRLKIGISFYPEQVAQNQKSFRYLVSRIREEMLKDVKKPDLPMIGDEMVAINDKPMSWWDRENFIFCKFPLKEQCEAEFFDSFSHELLGWNRDKPLKVSLKRGDHTWTVKIPVEDKITGAPIGSASTQIAAMIKKPCDVGPDRYPDFHLVYQGLNACIFESEKYPDVSVWRINSFRYRELSKDQPVDSLQKEADLVWDRYWKSHISTTKKIVFDLIENGGGDTPIAWYQLFFPKPFQEQYFQLKKIKELEDPEIRKEIFYHDNAHEIWFQHQKENGTYAQTPLGSFLPTQPQFCSNDKKDCNDGLFEPKTEGFRGQVVLLVDNYCISSCVGFSWEFKNVLKDHVKVVGFPDSADSAYARVYLDGSTDPSQHPGFQLKVVGRPGGTRQDLPEGLIFRQQVSVTRSTDKAGNIISGIPLILDYWVKKDYRDSDESWETLAFRAALAQ